MTFRLSSIRRGTLARGSSLKKGSLNKIGPKQRAWKAFRDLKAKRDRDGEGLLYCECSKVGLPRCGYGFPSLDLHHIVGRDRAPELYFDETNLVWLTRECHEKVHQR